MNTNARDSSHTRRLWGIVLVGAALMLVGLAAVAAGQQYEVVRSIAPSDGGDPQAGITQTKDGAFVGTTVQGYGTLFKMDLYGHFSTIHAFNGLGDGANPHGALLEGPDGVLYGTTMSGLVGWGSIFKVDAAGMFSTCNAFIPSNSAPEGQGGSPHAPLMLASDGKYYGMTTQGGMDNVGTLYQMDASCSVTTLHHFSGFDGAMPYEALVEFEGSLYGTTRLGGAANVGTVFRIDLGGANFGVLHSFLGEDGATPQSALVAADGVLYGTTHEGGPDGLGTVYRIEPSGANFAVLHHFSGVDGTGPHGSLVQAWDGHLYGTASEGGSGYYFGYYGSIFRLHTSGAGFQVLHRFTGADGAFPQARLIAATDGALYGTTGQGGSSDLGVVFRLVFVPVATLFPTSGPAAGGTAIALAGANFQPGARLSLGGVDALDVVVGSDTAIEAITPVLAAGSLNDVLVDNLDKSRGGILKGFFADFLDVPQADIFHGYVEKIFRHGITVGVGAGNYGRNASATRAQMAVFLLKGIHGPFYAPPPATGTVFADVPADDRFAPWIEQLHAEGITEGCNGGTVYCPADPMTREQMAVTLLKAKHGSGYTPPACEGIFLDVPCSAYYAPWIEQLYREGITAGCNGGTLFCPADPSTRGQTAVFLTKTFALP